MKSIKYVLLSLLLVSMISCRVEQREYVVGQRTAAGKVVYDRTAISLYHLLDEIKMLNVVDMYMRAATQYERDSIEELGLSRYNIRLYPDGVCTLKGDIDWDIKTGNQPLDKVGAVWSISATNNSYSYEYGDNRTPIPVDGLIVSCTSPERWNVAIKDNQIDKNTKSDANLTVERLERVEANFGRNSRYSISGSGKLCNTDRDNTYLNIDYDITQDLVYNTELPNSQFSTKCSPGDLYNPYFPIFINGIVQMSVVNTTHTTAESVKADMTKSKWNDKHARITFRGVTEVWSER